MGFRGDGEKVFFLNGFYLHVAKSNLLPVKDKSKPNFSVGKLPKLSKSDGLAGWGGGAKIEMGARCKCEKKKGRT